MMTRSAAIPAGIPPLPAGQMGIIVAAARNRAIGHQGGLPWQIPEDSAYFEAISSPGVMICGRRVFEEARAYGLLDDPHRRWVVVTRRRDWASSRVRLTTSFPSAVALAKNWTHGQPIWNLGGASIYAEGLAYADRLYLTQVDLTPEADTFFPPWEHLFDHQVANVAGQGNRPSYRFTVWEKSGHKTPRSQSYR